MSENYSAVACPGDPTPKGIFFWKIASGGSAAKEFPTFKDKG